MARNINILLTKPCSLWRTPGILRITVEENVPSCQRRLLRSRSGRGDSLPFHCIVLVIIGLASLDEFLMCILGEKGRIRGKQ